MNLNPVEKNKKFHSETCYTYSHTLQAVMNFFFLKKNLTIFILSEETTTLN